MPFGLDVLSISFVLFSSKTCFKTPRMKYLVHEQPDHLSLSTNKSVLATFGDFPQTFPKAVQNLPKHSPDSGFENANIVSELFDVALFTSSRQCEPSRHVATRNSEQCMPNHSFAPLRTVSAFVQMPLDKRDSSTRNGHTGLRDTKRTLRGFVPFLIAFFGCAGKKTDCILPFSLRSC